MFAISHIKQFLRHANFLQVSSISTMSMKASTLEFEGNGCKILLIFETRAAQLSYQWRKQNTAQTSNKEM